MCRCLLRKKKSRGGGSRANGEAEPEPADLAPGERNAIKRLILTERDDFPLEQSQDESLKNSTVSLSSPHGPLLIPILLF